MSLLNNADNDGRDPPKVLKSFKVKLSTNKRDRVVTFTKDWTSDLKTAIESANPEDPRFETEYFSGRSYRNGNMHLEFRRPDLVAKLNSLAGGRNLRGNHAA